MKRAKVAMVLGLISAWTCAAAHGQIVYPDWWDAAEYQATASMSYNSSAPDGLLEDVFLENVDAPSWGYIETAIELDYTWSGWPVPGPDAFGSLTFLAPVDYGQPVGTEPFNLFAPETSQADESSGDTTRLFTYTFADVPPWEGARIYFTGNWGPLGGTYNIDYDFRATWVPEPAALSMLAVGGLLVCRRRRCRTS